MSLAASAQAMSQVSLENHAATTHGIDASTYFGGSDDDRILDAAMAADGSIIIAGVTSSSNLPVSPGAFDATHNADGQASFTDGFVARIDPSTGALLASTYLGGSKGDRVVKVIAKADGTLVCIGLTGSPDFPTTPGAYSAQLGGLSDFFVAHLTSDLTALLASTLIGGSDIEGSNAEILGAITSQGHVVVAGGTESIDAPVTSGAFDTTFNGGGVDVWIGQLSPNLSELVFGTYLGGNGGDLVQVMTIGEDGSLILAGRTHSTDFPETVPPWPTALDEEEFVVRISPDGKELLHSGFIGGSNDDWFVDIALDSFGHVYLAGGTISDDFPTTPGVYDTTPNSLFNDGFVLSLEPDLTTIRRSTFSGLATNDILSMSVDSAGSPTYVTATNSSGFVGTPGAMEPFDFAVGTEWIVARLDPSFEERLYATYFGGSGGESHLVEVRVGLDGRALLAGTTNSPDFPVTPGAFQPELGGRTGGPGGSSFDGAVAALTMLPVGVSSFGSSTPGCTGPLTMGAAGVPAVHPGVLGLTCTGAPPFSTRGLLALSLSALTRPISAVGVACWIDPARLLALIPATAGDTGYARIDLRVPPDAALLGLQAAAQYLWRDPCGPAGWSASNALQIVVQS